MTDKKILIVDDNIALCDNLEDILREQGYETFSSHSCADGLRRAIELRPHVALLDLKLPDGLGTELMAELKKIDPDCVCIIATAFADVESAIMALELGALNYLHKPVRPDELLLILERAFEAIRLTGENRQVSAELVLSEAKFRMLFEHSADPSLIIMGNTFVNCNQAAVEILHANSKDELLNAHPSELSPVFQSDGRLSTEKADEMIATAIRFGAHRFEWLHRRMDGELFPVEVSLTLIQKDGQTMVFTVWRDITERYQAKEALLASERRFKSLIRNSSDSITILDKDGVQIYVSDVVEQMLGYKPSELINIPVIEAMIHPEDQEVTRAAFMKILQEGQAVAQYRHRHKNGSWVYLEAWGTNQLENPDIRGIVVNVRNITERKRAEEERMSLERQLLHAQKLESLGVLAGGIAHDFNNILTGIIGNAEMALMKLNPESPVLENLARIEKAAARAADLARQMLAYSGKGRFVIEAIDINRLVEEMGHMLEVSISKKAVLRYNLTKLLPTVNVDATQIRQIIMNLVINASEAIGDQSGVIAITTGCLECNDAYLQEFWLTDPIPEGLYVSLEIADSGCGMDKETLSRMFDPFFTTKFTGRGLGMAAVLGIVRGHKGAIKVYSEPGRGSSFKVLLPAGDKPAELFNGKAAADSWQGSGTALLVDDEETVRAIGAEMLKELGFDVITAKDGREAVEIFNTGKEFSVVILDLTMPHMDGEQCFRELRRLDPAVKVIMSSGFSEHEVTQKFVGKGLAGFVQKPYKLSVLKEALRVLPATFS